MKVTCKMSNIAMDMMLQLLNEAFKMAIFPKNHYEAKKYRRSLGLVWGMSESMNVKRIVHYFGKRMKICRSTLFAKVVVGWKRRLQGGKRF